MASNRIDEAARLLASARLSDKPFDQLPEPCRLVDQAEAYAAQDRLHSLLQDEGYGRLVGHKIGCTTPVMQRYLNIDGPCAGGMFEDGVVGTGARLRHDGFRRVGVECEIAVRLAIDLVPTSQRHDRTTVAAAIAACMAAIEIVDDRYTDYHSLDTPTLIADDFFHAGAVLGPAIEDWQALDLAGLEGRMYVDGETVGEGRGAAILDHPLNALAWLANAENARGRSLKAGDLVLLGSLVQTQWVPAGTGVEIDVGGLGSVSVHFD